MSQQRRSAWLPGSVGRREFLAGAAAAAVAPRWAGGHAGGPAARRPEVAAIDCPLWHRYDHMDAWHGPGWTEWELLETAPPRCEHDVPWPFAKPKYPYGPVVLGNTPERFGRLCRQAADYAADDRHRATPAFCGAESGWN